MTSHNLTVDGELRYIVQWFNEWSELQREDFLPILAEYLAKGSPEVYMNGVISGVSNSTVNDKPMSLFQCRIKLFREWSAKWPESLKTKLKEKVIEIDPSFAQKIKDEMSPVMTNGTTITITQAEDDEEPEEEPQIAAAPEEVAQTA